MNKLLILLAILTMTTARAQTMRVTATVYNAVAGQTDETPLITATNKKIEIDRPQRWIAISRDVERNGFAMGDQVCIENAGAMNGIWFIEDRMHYRWLSKIDFLVHQNIRLGKWRGVIMSKIDTECRDDLKTNTPYKSNNQEITGVRVGMSEKPTKNRARKK